MKLGRIAVNGPDGAIPRLVVAQPEQQRVIDLLTAERRRLERQGATHEAALRLATALFPRSMAAAIALGDTFLTAAAHTIQHADDEAIISLSSVQLLSPLDPPLLRDFSAFLQHIRAMTRRMGQEFSSDLLQTPPYYKGNPLTVIGPEQEVRWPSYTKVMDYELELGFVIGKPGINLTPQNALSHLFGVTILNDFTVSFTAPAQFPDIRVLEYAGIDRVNPVDVAVSAAGSSATSSTPPVNTTNASDLLFAANTVTSLTTGPGAGWTSRVITSPDGDIAEDQVVTAAGSYGSTAPLSGVAAWVMQMVAFKAAPSGPPPPPPTAPTNLAATAASSAQINLSWTNTSTTQTGVKIERSTDNVTFTQIALAGATAASYSDVGLSASTTYFYRVRATNASGDSAYSNTASATTASPPPPPPPPAASANPLISRGLTTASSPGAFNPSTSINDGDYGTFQGTWIVPGTAQPAWVALRVPPGPAKVLLSWVTSANFDWNLVNEPNYGAPGDYTIATSTNSTNGSDGTWTTVQTVTGNLYSDREHAFAMPAAGAWIKMTITAMPNSNGVITQNGGELQISEIDLHDATSGTKDTWLFLGDSITAFWANRSNQPSFAQIIHNNHPSFFPMMINGGHGGWGSGELVQFLPSFLAINPDVRFVALSYGSNDSAGNTANTAPFKSNVQQAITTLLNAGKVPVIPHIPYSCDGQHNNIPLFNQAIDQLVASNPGTLAGPDLYTYFQAHPAELSDCLHPNATGSLSFNRLWAQAMNSLYL